MDEAKSSTASVAVESDQNVQLSSSTLVDSAAVKVEIETLTGLLGDLERKASVNKHTLKLLTVLP